MSLSLKAPQSPAVKIVLFLALVGTISSVMYSGMPVITPESTSQRLQQIAGYVSGDATNAGRQGSLTYGGIAIHGWGYDKYVTVDNINLAFGARKAEGSREWGILVPQGNVTLDPLHSRRQIFRFNAPMTLTENGKPKATIDFGLPIRFGFLGGLEHKLQSMLVTIRVPGWIAVTPEPSGEGDKPSPTVISYDGFPEISIRNLPATGEREAKYELRNISVESGGKTSVTIGAIANDVYESTNKDKSIGGKYTLTVSDFTDHGDDKASKTCSLTSNLEYTSDVSLMTLLGIPATGRIAMKVNKIVVACDDFGVKIDGSVSRETDDPLPIGLLNVSIENVKAFLASSLISEKTRSELTAALPRMTGQPLDTLTSAKIVIKREKNGAIQLGRASTNEVNISLLTDLMQVVKDAYNAVAGPEAPAVAAPAKPDAPAERTPNGQ